MTQQWLRLMKRYVSKSGKLQSRLELPIHMWTYMWLIGWPPNRKIQFLRPQFEWISNQKVQDLKHLLGDDMNTEEGKGILQDWKKLMLYQGAPLPSPHTGWQVGRSFVVHSPHGSLSDCHEWMSPRCWTPRSTANSVPTIGLVSSGPVWPCRCRKQLAAANSASNTKALKPKHQCTPSLPLLLWSCYAWISQALRWL